MDEVKKIEHYKKFKHRHIREFCCVFRQFRKENNKIKK